MSRIRLPQDCLIKVATWNTEWREPGSRDARLIVERLARHSLDVVCLTEAHVGLLDDWGGYTVEGLTNWGGEVRSTRRKVLLWSRQPWTDIDQVGSNKLPPGLFARASTRTEAGELTVVGMVIPYHLANVRSGRRDRVMWEDHRRYLEALPDVVPSLPPNCVVMGDFNQRIPSTWVPRKYQALLANALAPLNLVTADLLALDGNRMVDHIACGPNLAARDAHVLSNLDDEGRRISDHCGVVVEFTSADPWH